MIVRELITLLGFRIDNGNLIIYNQTINNIHNAAERASSAMQGLFALVAAGAALGGITKVADEMQNLEARIKLLPQTIGDIGEAFNEVSAHASAARQPIKEYAKLYVRIGHAAKGYLKTQDAVLGITDTIAKGLIVGGASAQESSSVMTQLSQALGSGVLQGQEFNSMAEGAPQLLDALAVAMGKPREQLKKLASEGKVTTKDLILGFQKIHDDVEAQFLSMPINIGQAFTLIGNRFATFIARMNRESGAVTSIAQFFVDSFKLVEKGLDEMVDFFGGATNTIKFFGIALGAAITPILFKALAGLIGLVLSPIGLLVIGLTLVGLALDDFNTWMKGGKSILGDFFGSFGDGQKRFDEFKNSVIEFFTTGSFGKLTAKLIALKNGISDAFDGGVMSKFIGLIEKIFAYFYDAIPFKKLTENAAKGFAGLIDIFFGVLDIIAGAFKILIGFFTSDFQMMYEGLGQIVSGFVDIFSGVWEIIKADLYVLWIAIKIAFTAFFDYIYNVIVTSISNAFKAAADAGMAYLKSKLSNALEIALDASIGLATMMIPAPIKNMVGLGETREYTKFTPPPAVTPQAVAGAATSAGGVAQPMFNVPKPMSVNVYQTLPAGTPAETAKAAKDATTKAAESSLEPLARRLGQLQ